MKCNNCGFEWRTEKSALILSKCPYCGKTLIIEPKSKELTLDMVLKQIINNFGIEILQEPERCIAILMDVAPRLRKERQILKVALNFRIGTYFINCPYDERKININRAMQSLKFLNDESKGLIITAFVKALGWEEELLQDFFAEEEQKEDAGSLYQEGREYYKVKNYAEALKYFRKAAEQGLARAQYNLGWMYKEGRGVAQNDVEAVKWYHKAAEQGHAGAQNNLGWMYKEGRGVAQNDIEAVKWYRKAAEQDHAAAQNNLSWLYKDGRGVEQNYGEALKWLHKSAEQGFAVAQFNLGCMYEEGLGVTQDYTEAVKWYRKAAEQGNAIAQNNLGIMYNEGLGVAQDDAEAVKWYRKAAKQGNATAQNNLGIMYDEGRGVAQDYTEAVKWYRKAAEQDYARAQYNLGEMYENGRGVKKDIQIAKQWYEKAAKQGDTDAKKKLEELAKSGCFITTAVCSTLNKADDCDELKTMRWYRDKIQAENKEMALLIKEYYRVAPLVVKEIHSSSEERNVYKQLWRRNISSIYQNIKRKEYRKATLEYIDMLEGLCKQYRIPFAPGTEETIQIVRERNTLEFNKAT